MKKILRAATFLCLALFIMPCLCFCGYKNEIVACEDIVNSLTASEIGLPAGKIYSAKANDGEEGYISHSLISSLLGDGSAPPLIDSWLDYAFFLPSSSHPCELIVILCDSPNSAKDTARLLCRRLNTIKSVKKESDRAISDNHSPLASAHLDTTLLASAHLDVAAYLDGAEVIISRNYVLLIISSDTAAAKKTALAMIG